MDVASLLASVEAIAEGTFQVISVTNTIREGGKQRLLLFKELNALWMVLKLVECNFESEEENMSESWLRTICILNDKDGIFDQIGEVLDDLSSRLQPKVGLPKAIQTIRWPLDKSQVEALVNRLGRLKKAVNLALTSTSAAVIREIQNDTRQIKTAISNEDEKALLEWISTLNFLKQQNDFVRQVRQGTGQWFLEKDTFKRWVSDKDGMLWCSGIPGAGKTFLASIVFEQLKQIYQEQRVAVLIAYCGYNEAKSQSIDNLVATLLKQIVQLHSGITQDLREVHKTHSMKDTFPSLQELTKLLRKKIASFDRCFIIVDALDEILDEPRRLDLIGCLAHEKVNVMITSRYLDSIADLFAAEVYCDGCEKDNLRLIYHCKQCAGYGFDLCEACYDKGMTCEEEEHYVVKRFGAYRLDVEDTKNDVRNYVEWRIDHEARLLDCVTKKKVLRQEITTTLVQQSNGMFLLARLHMDALATKRTPKAIQQTLQNLPTEIKGTYEQAMQRIAAANEDDRRFAMNLLLWIAFSARPLTVPEVEHATAIEQNAREIDPDEIVNASDLTSLCAGLVIIDASNILRLVHFSAQTYLEENRGTWFPNGDLSIARHCLTYLSFKEFEHGPCSGPHEGEDFKARTERWPLLDYSCTYWGVHASRSEDPTRLTQQALGFLQSKTLLQTAVQVLWYSDSPIVAGWDAKSNVDPLHLAAYCGLAIAVTKLLRNGSQIDCRDSMGTTPLMYGVIGGHPSVVRALLQQGANPNLICYRGSSALHRAISAGNITVARTLIEEPGIDLQRPDLSRGDKTPLMLAASLRCSEILQTLLHKSDIDINAHSGPYEHTALTLAAETGDAQIVRQLLSHSKIDVNKRNKWCTALTEAATSGYFSVVEALLDYNADPEIQESPQHASGTPLNRAIDNGNNSIVRLLLHRGANPKVVDTHKRTIVHSAAVNGRTEILKILFEANCGVDINAQGTNGRTALHDAAYFDYCSTIEVLFENGARTDIHDSADCSPLGVARDQNNLDALRLLTKFRKQEESCDETDGHPVRNPRSLPYNSEKVSFLTAVKLGHAGVIQTTLTYAQTDATFDINVTDLDRHSALHYAVQKFHLEILSTLVSANGIDLNIQDRLDRNPLHWAALWNRYKAASILLSTKRVDVEVHDHFGETPLGIALYGSKDRLAVLLLEHGAWPEKELIQQALCAVALGGGGERLCERLVREGGADPGRKNAEGEGPWHLAEYVGNEAAARAILRLCEERETMVVKSESQN